MKKQSDKGRKTKAVKQPVAKPQKSSNPGRSNPMAPKMKENVPRLLSPHNKGDVPTTQFTGDASSVQSITRTNFTTTGTSRAALFLTNVGTSGTFGFSMVNAGGSVTLGNLTMTQNNLSLDGNSGGPVSGRAQKMAIDIRNVSPLASMAGNVFVGNMNSRIALPGAPSALTGAQWDTVLDKIKTIMDRSYTGPDFATAKSFTALVSDPKDYEDFGVWGPTLSPNLIGASMFEWSGMTAAPRPMETIVVIIEPLASTATYPANTYEFTYLAKHYLRWPQESPAYTSMRPIKLTNNLNAAKFYAGLDFR